MMPLIGKNPVGLLIQVKLRHIILLNLESTLYVLVVTGIEKGYFSLGDFTFNLSIQPMSYVL